MKLNHKKEVTGSKPQAKATEQLNTSDTTAAPLSTPQTQMKPNTTGMPDNLESGVASLSGMSKVHVKVHNNSDKPSPLNAPANAQGTDMHIASGPEKHLPHEAWHVVQQAQDRVRPTMQMKDGVAVNDDKELESEADVMGEKASGED